MATLHEPLRSRLRARLPRAWQALPGFVACWGLFLFVLHPWLMSWGATPEEQVRPLPGDTAPPAAYVTRAITIDAPPSAVWPWLLAIGQDRAGFHSNDWLENLTGADIHNAATLRPEWRERAPGDQVPMAGPPLRRLGGDVTLLTVRSLEPEQLIGDLPGRFVLLPEGDQATRLLLREPRAIAERSGLAWLIWDPLHFVMEQRMLRGLKERADGQPLVPPALQAVARLGWTLAGLVTLGLFLTQRGWWRWLPLPLASTLPAVTLAGDLDSALAAFLAVGITILGALAFGRRWWPAYLLLGSAVALLLLLAPDPYAACGLLLLIGAAGLTLAARRSGLARSPR